MVWNIRKGLRRQLQSRRLRARKSNFRPRLETLEERWVPAVLEPGFTEAAYVAASGLNFTTGLAWAPDGSDRLYISRKNGNVRVIENGVLQTQNFSNDTVFTNSECGLIGITFDRDYVTNHYVYLFMTVSATQQQIVRYTDTINDNATPGITTDDFRQGIDRTVIVSGLPTAGNNHDGGAVGIGFDNKLYWAIGDLGNGTGVDLDLTSLAAKVGRANLDGTIPNNNPFNDGAGPNNDYIWSRGWRNPFTFTFQETTGQLWINDVGTSYEQIFKVNAGDHAGYNDFEGNQPISPPNPNQYIQPEIVYRTNGTVSRNIQTVANNGAVRSGNLVTITHNSSSAAFLQPGNKITINDVADASFNGAFDILSVLSNTQFTYAQVGPNAVSGTSGTQATAVTQNIGGAITGGTFLNTTAVPAQYRGNYFFGDFNSSDVYRVALDGSNNVTSVNPFIASFNNGFTQIVDMAVGPDGAIYYVAAGSSNNVIRSAYTHTVQDLIVTPTYLAFPEGGRVGFSVRLAIAPASPVTVNIARTSGDSDLTVFSGSTLTFTPANFATPQAVILAAAGDADTVNDTATFSISASGLTTQTLAYTAIDAGGQNLVLSTTTLNVNEGGNNTFTVRLQSPPAGNVNVTVARTSGDTDINVTGGGTLTFTPTNYATPQTVTLAAAEDADNLNDTATISVMAPGASTSNVSVTAIDNDSQAPSITTTPDTTAIVGAPYSYDVDATGSPTPGYTLDPGFPSGMSIHNTTGVISWTPSGAGTFPVTVRAANGVAPDATQSYSITVSADAPPTAVLTQPTNGATISGTTAEFFGDGFDDVGTVRAEFYVDGILRYTDNTPGGHYHFGGTHLLFDTTQYSDGPHTLRMTVVDTAGQSGSAQVNVTISNNDAPVLADTALSLTVSEDAPVPSGALGSLVSAFTGGITDVDSGALKGIAVTATNETNGQWYYTTNAGSNWTLVGVVSTPQSLLLANNANTRLYFRPNANFTGGQSTALTLRAWDQTSGTAGTKVDTATNGGTTAFSSASDLVDVNVTAVAAFTAGDLVAVRVGDGSGALNSSAAPVFLDEFSPGGTAVQSIALPTSVSGSNRILTLGGSTAAEGALNLSSNGQYLTLGGYDAAVGTANVAVTASSTINRVVARVDASGNVDTSTRMDDGYTGGAPGIRSAVTDDGTRFWTGGQGGSGLGGIRFVPFGNTGSSTAIGTAPMNGPNNTRVVSIFDGQLYASLQTGMPTLTGILTVGTGLPTTGGQASILLPNLSGAGNAFGYSLLDRDASVAGLDTLYVADQTSGLLKYSFDGTAWTARSSVAGVLTGLTAVINGSSVDIYSTRGAGAGNTIVKLTDTAAFNADVSGSFTTIATAAANTAFRGLAFAPPGAPAASALSIDNVSLSEGSGGPTNFAFTVTLTPASNQPVTVAYGTADASATSPADYATTSGALTFAAGVTALTLTVAVNGDMLDEANELFQVNLSAPVNATISDAQGIGMINDDDPQPGLAINDVSLNEGNTGTTNFIFTVTLSPASGQPVTVVYGTANASATEPADYTSTSGTLTFAAGVTTQTVTVAVNGEAEDEPNETFQVTLSGPSSATLGDPQGIGTITDDDLLWHNSSKPADVDEDTFISSIDLINMVDALNTFGGVFLPSVPSPPTKLVDVSGDDNLSSIDLFMMIDALNQTSPPFAPSFSRAALLTDAPAENLERLVSAEQDAVVAIGFANSSLLGRAAEPPKLVTGPIFLAATESHASRPATDLALIEFARDELNPENELAIDDQRSSLDPAAARIATISALLPSLFAEIDSS